MTEDFVPGDTFIIVSGLQVNVLGNEDLDIEFLQLEIGSSQDNTPTPDRQDPSFLAIATPSLIFPNVIGMVVNDPDKSFGNADASGSIKNTRCRRV